MRETDVEPQVGGTEDKRSGAWDATEKAFSGIAAALNGRARSETTTTSNGKGVSSQTVNGPSVSNPMQSTSSVASKTGSTTSQSKRAALEVLSPKEKLAKIHSNQAACGRDLFDEPYYHGYMTGAEAEELLGDVDGTFVVHKSPVKSKPEIMVSVVWNGCPQHLRVKKTKHGNNVWLYKYCFKNVADLIRYHNRKRYPVSKEGIILYTWIQRQQWQLFYEQVELLDKIGEHDSDELYRGKLARGGFSRAITVLVKTVRCKSMDSDSRIRFLRESNRMLGLKHKNVIRLYGVCIQKDPILIVREYAPGGSLLSRVRNVELELPLDEKVRYCRHIAAGMQYLHDEKIIHRELSAKNCLLGKHDTAKVVYFGFSAPFGSKHDICFRRTHGKCPYEKIRNNVLLRQKILMEDLRLAPPEGMPPEMVELMMQCFAEEKRRPHFLEICSRLSKKAALLDQLRCYFSKNFAVVKSHLQRTLAVSDQCDVESRPACVKANND